MPGPERRTAGSPVMDDPNRPPGGDRPAGGTPPDEPPRRPAPVDQLRRARERVRGLARDVERLARTDIAPEQFFAKLLDVLRESLGAPAAAVWTLDAGALSLAHERGLEEAGFRDVPRADRAVAPLLSDTLSTGESSAKDGGDPTNKLPTAHLYLTAALVTEGTPSGALQVLQRADAPAEARPGFLQFVEQLAGHASEYLTRQKNRGKQAGDLSAGGFWGEFEKAVLLLQRARGVKDVAGVAVNESRRLLDVDRVSLVRRRGRKYPVEAVSGQDTVHKRANLIKRLSKLSKAVMKTREPLLFNGGHRSFDGSDDAGELPPQISGPLSDYLEEAGSRMIAIVPLMSGDRDLGKKDLDPEERHRKKPPEVMGALIVEQVAESRLAPGLTAKLDLLNDHVAAALQTAREDERIFLRGPLRVLGRAQEYLHGRKLLKTLAAVAVLVATGLALWLVPHEYRVTGEGVLVPSVQRKVFAPFDGEVVDVLVEGGQRVDAGEPLLKVRNDDLREQLISTSEKIAEKTAEFDNLERRRSLADRKGERDEVQLRLGEMAVVEAELDGLREKLALLNERAEKTVVRAPIAGTVATFQLERLLRNRPVGRGEVLLEVMDDGGPWRLELAIPDTRAGHLDDAMTEAGTVNLPVEYAVAGLPERTFSGTLARVIGRAEPDQELGNVLEAYVTLDEENAPKRRTIGMEVTAKVDCGDEPLFFVLFGDVVEFVQRNVWL